MALGRPRSETTMKTTGSGRLVKRQELTGRTQQTVRAERRIRTLEDLRGHLQIAIEVEHSTIPPYLCALYSIEEDRISRRRKSSKASCWKRCST